MKLRNPDLLTLYTADGECTAPLSPAPGSIFVRGDIELSTTLFEQAGTLSVKVRAASTPLRWIRLRWNFTPDERRDEPVKILGDHWERGYGDLVWRGIEPGRMMPWYILVSNGSDACPDTTGRRTEGFGVRVRPGAVCAWQYDGAGVTLWADVRSGGEGVILEGRTLSVCTVLFRDYENTTAFAAGRAFCAEMCPDPRLPKHPVYGSNNWYYAYGKSSHDEILGDTKIVAEQCAGLENLPYMVIDDGWQKWNTDAPWTVTNERFRDMKALADEMRAAGVRPGIWVRYLVDGHRELDALEGADESWRLSRDANFLDPSHPAVLDYVARITRTLAHDWGYALIKHDYSTFDIFGNWGMHFGNKITKDGWHFHDRSRTSAEIVVNFYKTIREAAGEDCVIIGCNTIPHLCAGLHELNRTGDDTSGFEWDRTRKMGVNTLAFRLIQNGTFYMADADCVGISGAIGWAYNRQWLDVLARTGSPLFVSCKPGVLNADELAELKAAWAVNSVQKNEARPLDWMENETPALWEIDGEVVRYNWYNELGAETFRGK